MSKLCTNYAGIVCYNSAHVLKRGSVLNVVREDGTTRQVAMPDALHAMYHLVDNPGSVGSTAKGYMSCFNIETGQNVNKVEVAGDLPPVVASNTSDTALVYDPCDRSLAVLDWRAGKASYCDKSGEVAIACPIPGTGTAVVYEVKTIPIRNNPKHIGYLRLVPIGPESTIDRQARHDISQEVLFTPNEICEIDAVTFGGNVWVVMSSPNEVCVVIIAPDNSRIVRAFRCSPSQYVSDETTYFGRAQIGFAVDNSSAIGFTVPDSSGGMSTWWVTPEIVASGAAKVAPHYELPQADDDGPVTYVVDEAQRQFAIGVDADGTIGDIMHRMNVA